MKKLKKSLLRKKRKKETLFTYIMSVLHLWLGLLSSLIIFIVCITGSIYAFKQQIENLVNYDVVYSKTQHTRKVAIDTILQSFEKKYGKATQITISDNPEKNILITSFSKKDKGVTGYYNSSSGKLKGLKNETAENFFSIVLDIHRFLLAGDIGKLINGIAILIFVFMLFSGFIMWLPKKLKQLKNGFVIKLKAKFYRINYDLHKVLGFYSILLLFFIAVTGLYVSFHWVKNTIIVGLGGNSIIISNSNTALKKDISNSFNKLVTELSIQNKTVVNKNTSIQEILIKSDSIYTYPGAYTIQLPNELVKNFSITKINKQNIIGFFVPNKLEFNINGTLRKVILFRNLKLNQQFKALAKPLHTGEFMGLPSSILYFIVSLIGCSLPITGFIIWWKKIN